MFDLLLAYICSVSLIGCTSYFAYRNKKQGWHRERSDFFREVAQSLAKHGDYDLATATAAERVKQQAPAFQPAAAHTLQLLALAQSLGQATPATSMTRTPQTVGAEQGELAELRRS
ncbi:MAG: hypothetical protein H7Y20_08295 [Bryobacteraceae bacterium]|nr:hypothetical protein [Bryobacteraceae bacterium]